MPEIGLIKHLLKKEVFNTYFSSLPKDHLKDQHRELWHVYSTVDELHSKVDADLSLQELQTYFYHKHPDANPSLYTILFDKIEQTDVSEAVANVLFKQIKERQEALRLSEAAFKFSTGNGGRDALDEAYKVMSTGKSHREEFEFVTDDIEELLDQTVRQSGLRWRLNLLNKSLGSLRKGDFGFLFARPETGKTTFLASEISYMLTQLKDGDGPIVWFNNEEQSNKVKLRLVQAYFGIRLDQLLANPRKYNEQFNREMGGKFLLPKETNITKSYVERLLNSYPPSLILFDQLPKVKGFAADREDLKIGEIAKWARELASEYAPTVGVFQAGGVAEGQKWLTMDHVANVTTAAQAEGDWILGIGKTHAEGAEQLRYLNVSKNKLAGDTDSVEAMRHVRQEVLIEPVVARYKDIVKYD